MIDLLLHPPCEPYSACTVTRSLALNMPAGAHSSESLTMGIPRNPQETKLLSFHGFVQAMAGISNLNSWGVDRIFDSILSINCEGLIAIHAELET